MFHVSVCVSVSLESELWQNSSVDLDAIWCGEWGWSSDECIRSLKGMGNFGVNLGHTIVTNGTLLHSCARVTCSSQITLGTCHYYSYNLCDLFCMFYK